MPPPQKILRANYLHLQEVLHQSHYESVEGIVQRQVCLIAPFGSELGKVRGMLASPLDGCAEGYLIAPYSDSIIGHFNNHNAVKLSCPEHFF